MHRGVGTLNREEEGGTYSAYVEEVFQVRLPINHGQGLVVVQHEIEVLTAYRLDFDLFGDSLRDLFDYRQEVDPELQRRYNSEIRLSPPFLLRNFDFAIAEAVSHDEATVVSPQLVGVRFLHSANSWGKCVGGLHHYWK